MQLGQGPADGGASDRLPGQAYGGCSSTKEFGGEFVDELARAGPASSSSDGGGQGEQVVLDLVEQRIWRAVLAGLEVGRIHPRILPALHCTTRRARHFVCAASSVVSCGHASFCAKQRYACQCVSRKVSPAATRGSSSRARRRLGDEPG